MLPQAVLPETVLPETVLPETVLPQEVRSEFLADLRSSKALQWIEAHEAALRSDEQTGAYTKH